MKKNNPVLLTVVCGCFLLMLGCVPSLYPIYNDEKDIVWDPDLVGHWVDGKESWLFSPLDADDEDSKAYRILVLENGELEGNLEARLVKLGDQRFLDTTVEELKSVGEYDALHLAPTHLIWHVTSTSPTLQLRPMDPDWLDEYIEENPDKIAVEKLEERDMLLLRAKPKDLQAFVLQHLGKDELFSEDGPEMKRGAYGKKADK